MLTAAFTYSPSSPSAGQQVSFDGSASAGGVEFYTWSFPSGPLKDGAQSSYTFDKNGSYQVKLEVGKKDGSCPLGICTASTTKTIVVGGGSGGGGGGGGGGTGLDAAFDTDAECISDFGVNQCQAQTGEPVSFTGTTAGCHPARRGPSATEAARPASR